MLRLQINPIGCCVSVSARALVFARSSCEYKPIYNHMQFNIILISSILQFTPGLLALSSSSHIYIYFQRVEFANSSSSSSTHPNNYLNSFISIIMFGCCYIAAVADLIGMADANSFAVRLWQINHECRRAKNNRIQMKCILNRPNWFLHRFSSLLRLLNTDFNISYENSFSPKENTIIYVCFLFLI